METVDIQKCHYDCHMIIMSIFRERPIDEPVIEDPMGEIIDLEEETVEEAEELSHILNRRLEDLLASSNTFDFSSTWNLSEELNKEKIQYLEDALLKFTLI